MKVIITNLLPEDFEDAVNLVVKFAEEEFEHEFDIAEIAKSMAHFVVRHLCMAIKDKESGELVGIFVFDEDKNWWAKSTYLYNAIAYVCPEYRSTKLLNTLIRYAEAYAGTLGKEFVFGLSLVQKFDKKERAMSKLGYEKAGGFYRKVG